ncbi:C6 zinc finger domain protein [Amylocarpus encephaloides]|uniref:C6 zinc finger domain protein n=1 Tax=Amylocarpus encephaloides TaxID=45428 RepID=A0A9P7YNU1_9HELO|nr:C6 zinc finger domain protein [Amylocarpus encephaloides]
MSSSMVSPKITRQIRNKVKSGCTTCKIRKVKCDEARPSCDRCISTGRVCDGYGIWGGGSSFRKTPVRLSTPLSLNALSSIEGGFEYFDWFKCRTVKKLPGSFMSGFWTTLLFQASTEEPAVLHALLALSSVHKQGTLDIETPFDRDGTPSKQEQFSLQHYLKATKHLQPHLSANDRASSRVALIACVVFVCSDLLQGNFMTAQTHMYHGLEIIGETSSLCNKKNGVLLLKPCQNSTDKWIVEALSRLHLQMELFKHSYSHPRIVLLEDGPEVRTLVFESIKHAWKVLERLLNKIFHLTHLARQHSVLEYAPNNVLSDYQSHIRNELSHWLVAYESLGRISQGHRSDDEEKCERLLYKYQVMATIMADASLKVDDEMVYDDYTDRFMLLITQLATLSTLTPVHGQPRRVMDMSHSVIDLGWIPLLYYTATKCRVHRIRLQAIRLLESRAHREGIWDSIVTACIARKVLQIEEGEFYEGLSIDDDFPLLGCPSPEDLSAPILPEIYRIRKLEVVLNGAPVDTISLFYGDMLDGVDCRVLLAEFDMNAKAWKDKEHR